MKKLFVCTAILLAASFNLIAQEEKPADVVALPESAEMMQVAGKLVKYGYEKGQALPLIQAVEIYQTVGGNAFTGKKDGETATTKDGKVSYDINQLIADATELAEGDANLLALIEGLKTSATRGATSNYEIHRDVVKAGATDTYDVRFRGGEQAIVVVSGDGDTDLDLYVYNPSGTLVAKDDDYSDDCVASWYPSRTQTYTIKIKNRGSVANVYRMGVN